VSTRGKKSGPEAPDGTVPVAPVVIAAAGTARAVSAPYQVLARRLRPQTFEEIVGQDHVTRTLRSAIESGRVAHAFLFAGPRGVGKTTMARVLAKALNCESGPTPRPCNACSTCREIADASAIDVLELDGASNRGIDDAREIVENVRYRPAKSRYKLYIIDEVHQLTKEAFNALLKTLEEPPPHVKFIFATTEPDRVLPTILSRCQRYDFRRLSAAEIRDFLQRVVEREGIRISPEGLFLIAREADGSVRDSQSLLEQVTAFAGSEISDEALREILGVADRTVLYDMAEAIIERQPARCLELADQLYRYGYDVRRLCRDLLEHARNVMVAKLFDDETLLADVPPGEIARVRAQATRRSADDLQRMFRILLETDEEVARSLHPQLVLEMAVVRLASIEPLVPMDEIVAKLEALETRLTGGDPARPTAGSAGPSAPSARPTPGTSAGAGWRDGVEGPARGAAAADDPVARARAGSAAPPAPAAPSRSTPPADASARPASVEASGATKPPQTATRPAPGLVGVSATAPAAQWKDFLGAVQRERKALYMALVASRCLVLGEAELTIGVASEIYARELAKRENREGIEAIALTFFGRPLAVKVQAVRGAEGVDGGAVEGESAREQDLARESVEHPTVQAALDILGGEVRAVRPRRRPES
jgi:DNA polymerase-3 subunit gamma/tau